MPPVSVLRTPDARFDALADWPYAPHYMDDLPGLEGLRLHYIDSGPKSAKRTYLCLHGQRTWAYAFRHFIKLATGAGHRVVAPDFLGFGRSDKPVDDDFYSFAKHRRSVLALIERLGLENITLVGFDWGGWIATTLPMELGGRVRGMVLGNMTHQLPGPPRWSGFYLWLASHNAQPDPAIGAALARHNPGLSDAAIAAYDAPFPDARYKAGVRRFPNLIPYRREDDTSATTRDAITYLETKWQGRCLPVVGVQDPVLGAEAMALVARSIRGCRPPLVLENVGPLVFEHSDIIAAHLKL